MYPSRHVAAPLLLIVAVVAGCSRKRASPTPATPAAPVVNGDARADSLARADAARRDSLAKEASLREARERRLAEARAAIAAPVYFAYDRSNLSAEARGILDAKAPILSASPALRLRLNGHTDDRGSDEYNLALGQRRAASARAYLTALGVPAARLEITSFGEEEPVCRESGDSCWSRNRRVEFDIMAGADMIVVR